MRRVIRFEPRDVMPSADAVTRAQGIDSDRGLSDRCRILLDRALEIYGELAEPRGLVVSISHSEFEGVYGGEGLNSHESPVAEIYPRAKALALFAATIGETVGARIWTLFEESDLALGYLLDAVASEGAGMLAERLAGQFTEHLTSIGHPDVDSRVLPYSPGYCGWHVSGQRRLFDYLGPDAIGITLNERFLMTPLKSVSGVLVAGGAHAHRFRPNYQFCKDCETHDCRERMASVSSGHTTHEP
jgi:hypothetical protein